MEIYCGISKITLRCPDLIIYNLIDIARFLITDYLSIKRCIYLLIYRVE